MTVREIHLGASPQLLPLSMAAAGEVLAWRDTGPVKGAQFLAHVAAVAAWLPEAPSAVNLCEDRYAFLVTFCALVWRGQANLLPSSRAPAAIDEVSAHHPGCYVIGDLPLTPVPSGYFQLPDLDGLGPNGAGHDWPLIPAGQVAAIGYTSGSTGVPGANVKTWGSLHASNAGNAKMLRAALGPRLEVVATVPPQHMYGLEMSVLLPLLGSGGIHAGRPFFPADVAASLRGVPAPRVLVTTPVHLRALVASGVSLPPLAAMVSATAPLPLALAAQAETQFNAPLLEVFGSTETCVLASRRPAKDERWQLYEGVSLMPHSDGTAITAPQLPRTVMLADIVELAVDGRCFTLRGRQADMVEIAGKRASLGDLTRRLLAIPGVADGVMVQLDDADALGVHRIAALVVAPECDEYAIFEALRQAVDPVFLPRPLRRVCSLPRNETGKLPRAALMALLRRE